MNKILIFCIAKLVIICLLGCHEKKLYKNSYTLIPSSECINIKIGNKSRNLSYSIQYFNDHDTNFLAVITEKYNSVEIYDLDSGKRINLIETAKEGVNAFPGMMGFIMKNADTMLAISTYPRFIGFLNRQGQVLKKIPWGNSEIGKSVQQMIPLGPYRPILNDSIISLSLITHAQESNGILTSIKKAQSNLHVDVNLNSGECKLFPFTYPDELVGRDLLGIFVFRTMGYKDCFIYNFNLIDGLFVSKGDSSFKRIPIETNYVFSLAENKRQHMSDLRGSMKYNLAHDQFEDICYDRYRECYYIFVRKRNENLQNNTDLRSKFLYADCFIIILDKNLKFMGEVFLPDNIYSFKMTFVTQKGLYISEDHINNPTYSEDFMRFRLFMLEKL